MTDLAYIFAESKRKTGVIDAGSRRRNYQQVAAHRTISAPHFNVNVLQKKASCACGGGCPRCSQATDSEKMQTKLQVSTPGDQYEQEADRVADRVRGMREPTLQRSCATCSGGATTCSECQDENEKILQRNAAPLSDSTPRVSQSTLNDLGPGQPLDSAPRSFFEPRFGHDFSGVRVYTDVRAADAAQQVSARAYTVGRDIVFGAGQYQPETIAGRHLLAHELTHILQQSGNGEVKTVNATAGSKRAPVGSTMSLGISRVDQNAAPLQRQGTTNPEQRGPCDQTHTDELIEPAFTEARRWRNRAARWLEAHLDHIRARGALSRDGYVRIGQRVFDELRLLEQHFGISRVLRIALPSSRDDLVSVTDLERLGNASYWVRRRFGEVELTLSYLCQANCPRGRAPGSDVLGSAAAGSREVTFYTNCFDNQSATARAGVALHEAFHASFSEFDHDTYSFESSYPGHDGLTNAESFSTFAAIIATGSNYRIRIMPEMDIQGRP